MSLPPKPPTKMQTVLLSLLMLSVGAWLFYDGMTALRTGQPIPFKDHHGGAGEYFLVAAGATVIGFALLGVAAGWIKGRQDPP